MNDGAGDKKIDRPETQVDAKSVSETGGRTKELHAMRSFETISPFGKMKSRLSSLRDGGR